MEYNKVIDEIRTNILEKNINFLIGSGASVPYFQSLGNIEVILADESYKSIRELIYYYYYQNSIKKNEELFNNQMCEYQVSIRYIKFIRKLVSQMNRRNDRISPNRANIFTTNYDIFFERAIDIVQYDNPSLILNDGGHGYFTRYLSAENYHKTVSRNGVFDNYHKELPTINLIKCHGSVMWNKIVDNKVGELEIRKNLEHNKYLIKKYNAVNLENEYLYLLKKLLTKVDLETETKVDILSQLKTVASDKNSELKEFYNEYQKLQIINPEKTKFNSTVIQEHYYSMLRLLSYELERDQTILIIFGFSFEDEHIRSLIKRSVYNPGLRIYIFAYSVDSAKRINRLLTLNDNSNIVIIGPKEDGNIDFESFNQLLFGGM